jgi:hypothetical protein
MKFFNKGFVLNNLFPKLVLILLFSMFTSNAASAHVSPAGCTGSGLGINLFTNVAQANIGDTISYSLTVFNGSSTGSVVCDATNIQVSLVTPDGISHPITLTRTSLSNGQTDFYPNVVAYVARSQDITSFGTLAATASDTGVIHQNITDSKGGGNQGLNVFVLNTFHVIKQVVNNNGGTATASSFTVHLKKAGVDVAGSPAPGTPSPGTLYSLIAGTYTVSEDPNVLYTTSFSGDCDASGNITLLGSDNKTCTIVNDDISPPATLHVIKQVINNNGGVATASSFTLHVKSGGVDVAGSPMAGTVTPGTSYTLAAGTYAVSEDANPSYAQTFGGDCDASGNVTLLSGDNKNCTVTNDDIAVVIAPSSLNVIKTVINDNGGTKTTADFPLFVNGAPVVSGITNVFPAGAYTITETSNSTYTPSFSGDCDASGHLNLVPGDHKICLITNDDIAAGGIGHIITVTPVPPLIDVVKIPTPLALPNGPGPVTYTYTLRNIGTVPVSDVTMVGDTCSPITLLSGDTNHDSKLDLNEVWIYSCTTNLTTTHTNTVVATGFANGISAVDTASATVVVGAPQLPNTGVTSVAGLGGGLVPPLIHVTKVPSPLALPIGGGFVTYTEIVTNPGIVPLSNVHLTDDKCGPVNYISGDRNNDSKLDPSEAWAYTCRTRITRTTTNTVVAEGSANGITVRDFAIATVVVSTIKLPNTGIPGLPNTGYPPREDGGAWNIIAFAAVFILVSVILVKILKKSELLR